MIGITLLAITVFAQNQGWTTPSSLLLDGIEKLGTGQERPFRIQLSKGKTLTATRRGILDWAGGSTRLEINTSAGYFTWLEGGNRTLRLAVPSHPDIQTWFQPVRLSKASVSSGQLPGWKRGTDGIVASRPVWLISSATNPAQSLWVDQAHGYVLQQVDHSAGGAFVTEDLSRRSR